MSAKWETTNDKDKKDTRIEFLEKQARRTLFGMDLLASIGELQHGASMARDPEKIFSLSLEYLKRFMEFHVQAFYLVDEKDSEFVLKQVDPPAHKEMVQKEIDAQIENGTFAWALNQNRPVVMESKHFGKTMILHVLATKSRIRGMFLGVLTGIEKNLNDSVFYPLSIILQHTANSLEGAALYEQIYEQNQNLEETVRKRTKALENQANELKEEIAFRQLAEESLMVAKEEAEMAAKVKSEFLTNMSHEIRTPINAILGYAEILQIEGKKLQRRDLLEDLKAIESAGKHLLGLINGILDLSKMQAGQMKLHFEKFKILDLVEDVMLTIRPLAKKKNLGLEVTYQMFVPSMYSDSFRIRQILLNLLGNACKFTDEGTINLKIASKKVNGEDWIDLIVSDTGIGIDAGKIPHLFDEFSQGDSSTTRKYGGTGLGLAISQRLCRMLGGDISVTSELGKGSVFTVSFPLEASSSLSQPQEMETLNSPSGTDTQIQPIPHLREAIEPPPKIESHPPEFPSFPGKERPRILVIDDEPVVRDLVQRFLEREGFEVDAASGGAEGLRLARERHPDIITLDVMMPEKDGWAVLKELKPDPVLASIPVVMITQVHEQEKAEQMGAVACLTKPIDWDRLIEVIKKYLKSSLNAPILVVEDDTNHRGAVCRILSHRGWKTIEAQDGNTALEAVKNEIPSLILLDLILPEMDGFEFITQLRRTPSWKSIPVFVVTAKELSRDEKKRLHEEVEHIFQKGNFTRDDLIEQIRKFVCEPVAQEEADIGPLDLGTHDRGPDC